MDIDSDILIAVKKRARKERKSAGRVMSSILRNSLNGSATASGPEFIVKNGIRILAPRGEVITCAHVEKLLEEEDY
ncbi:MAG: hypothetical protein WKF34_04315 [Pyrinomonadaceae bacterium]